jgi:hypothetical protein
LFISPWKKSTFKKSIETDKEKLFNLFYEKKQCLVTLELRNKYRAINKKKHQSRRKWWFEPIKASE